MGKAEELVFGRASEELWAEVERVILTHYSSPDLDAARALYGSIAAHRIEGPPVWPMLVAPPGSMKTELLNALRDVPSVHMVDVVTPQTFISGQIITGGKGKPSLLHRIGKSGILIAPDFSTVLAMKIDHRASVLADLRRIYDGQLRKEFGTVDDPLLHTWEGRITFVAAVTPAVDRHYGLFQALGDRFIMIRWPRAGGIQAALAAMNQNQEAARKELKKAVTKLFCSARDVKPEIPKAIQVNIAALTEIIVRARTHIDRDTNKKVVDVPEPESATRLAQEFAQLAKGSAYLVNRSIVDDRDFAIVRRVAFDSIPPNRRKVLDATIAGEEPDGIPLATLHYTLEDLSLLGLMCEGEMSPQGEELLCQAGITG